MRDLRQALALLEAAGRDLSALKGMDNPEVFANEIFGFHAQQAVEKLLKAWLALLGEEYPLTHNLEVLLDIIAQRAPAAGQFWPLVDYTPYAGRLRYTFSDVDAVPLDRAATTEQIDILAEHLRRELLGAAE